MRRKLKTFFRTLKRSAIDLEYYKDVIKAPFSFSLKYHLFLLFLVTFFSGIRFAVLLSGVIPTLPLFIENAKSGARELYPAELVVELKDGEITTNVEEPYVIDLPQAWGGGKNFIRIDTNASIDDFEQYDTLVLVTKKSFVAKDEDGYKVYPFSDYKGGNYTLTADEYSRLVDPLLPLLDFLPAIAVVLIIIGIFIWPFIGSFLWLLWNLLWFLIPALILLIIVKLAKRNLRFGQAYQIVIHAFTLPILISFALGLIDSGLPTFISTAIAVVFGILVIIKIPARS